MQKLVSLQCLICSFPKILRVSENVTANYSFSWMSPCSSPSLQVLTSITPLQSWMMTDLGSPYLLRGQHHWPSVRGVGSSSSLISFRNQKGERIRDLWRTLPPSYYNWPLKPSPLWGRLISPLPPLHPHCPLFLPCCWFCKPPLSGGGGLTFLLWVDDSGLYFVCDCSVL